MNEARDIVKLALPFAAGALSFSCLPTGTDHTYHIASISLTLLAFSTVPAMQNRLSCNAGELIKIIATGILLGIFTQASSSLSGLIPSDKSPLSGYALILGKEMQTQIDNIGFNSSDTSALIKALLTGNRADIPKEITSVFRTSGASHILALSGLHLGIIHMIVSKLSGILGNNRKAKVTRSILCIIVCSIYTSATGAGASIVRALIFVVIAEISKILHRKPELKSIFASSLILHLIFRPEDIHSIGFQLSYAAIAGIAWIYPHIHSLWPDEGKGIMKRIWNGASLSISCQLTTAPLAWFYFGTFPQYFILTNLIALPLTTLIIPAALLTTILSSMGICPDILIHGTEMMVNALCSTLTIISDM